MDQPAGLSGFITQASSGEVLMASGDQPVGAKLVPMAVTMETPEMGP